MRTIAKLAFKETLYKRIFLITILMTVLFLVFYGVATHYAAGKFLDQPEGYVRGATDVLRDSFVAAQFLNIGLYFSSFIACLLAILASVGSISGEIESHQIDTLLARPLRRRDLLLGKWIGLGGLMVIYSLCLYGSILALNQWIGGPLRMELGAPGILKAAGIFALQPLLLVAVALWLSCRMTTINGGIVMIIMYGISFVGGMVEQLGAMIQMTALTNIGILSSLIFPVDALFRKMTIFLLDSGESPISFARQGYFGSLSEPSDVMILYACLFGVAALWVGSRTFASRDL